MAFPPDSTTALIPLHLFNLSSRGKDTSGIKTALARQGKGESQSGAAGREQTGTWVLAACCTEDTLH